MTWGEAMRQTKILARDTASQVGAALAGWQYPVSRGELALMDLYDAFAQATFKKPKPYPRPWDAPPKRFGSRVANVAGVLAAHRAAIDATRDVYRDARGRLRHANGRFARESVMTPSGGTDG